MTLRIYCRQVSPGEEDRIIDNANKKNKLDGSDPNKLRQAVEAESNLRDVADLVHKMHREHEPLLHCAVYLEMTADSAEHLRQLQTDVLTAAKSLRNALLFNVLAYMSDRLLTAGNTVAALDELYLWLSNPVAIEYIRNCLKRVRKRDSALMMASQNLEDFDQEGVREMTKPLFAIPPHQFLFNPGSIGRRFYMDMLQLDEAEFELIRRARRGECLFKCGAERYHLKVIAPDHKAVLFGTAGGK